MAYIYKKEEYELIGEGDYECTIEKAEFKETPMSHRKKIALTIRIRSDVEQPCQGRIVFDDIWSSSDDDTRYDEIKINRILGTQDIEVGTEFKTIEDVVKVILGAYVKCHIEIKHDNYQDKDVNRVKYYRTSEKKPQKLGDQPTSDNLDSIELDDDIPF